MNALRGLGYGTLFGALAGIASALLVAVVSGLITGTTSGFSAGVGTTLFVGFFGAIFGGAIGMVIGLALGLVIGAAGQERRAPEITASVMLVGAFAIVVLGNDNIDARLIAMAVGLSGVAGAIGWTAGTFFRKAMTERDTWSTPPVPRSPAHP